MIWTFLFICTIVWLMAQNPRPIKVNKKLIIILIAIGVIIFVFARLLQAGVVFGSQGREHDDVEGQECEHGNHTNNPHCLTPIPTPTLIPTETPKRCVPTPSITLQPTLQLSPTPSLTVTPTPSPTPTDIIPTATQATSPTPTTNWEEDRVIYFPDEGRVYGPNK